MGTRLNHLAEAVLTSTNNLRFEQKYEKYQSILSENFPFLEVKFSVYLDRRVFVMRCRVMAVSTLLAIYLRQIFNYVLLYFFLILILTSLCFIFKYKEYCYGDMYGNICMNSGFYNTDPMYMGTL